MLFHFAHMDNPKEGCYLLWDVQRKEGLWTLRNRKYCRHAGSHDPENPSRIGATSRFWHRPPHRAAERGSAATERRHRLYLSAATPAAWMDSLGVGHVGKQTQSQVLLHHQAWAE